MANLFTLIFYGWTLFEQAQASGCGSYDVWLHANTETGEI